MGSSAESAVLDATFTVQSDGRIRLRSYLDYELRHVYKVPVKVSDGEFTAQTYLLVHVLDVNDEPPEFEINPKQLVADENASVGKLIGRIRVRDPDGEGVNGQIQCWEPAHIRRHQVLSFLPDPSTNPLATVYDLTTRVVLDREAVTDSGPGLLFVYLICSDGHGLTERKSLSATQHTATMTATLSVRDDNDHRPMFSQSTYHVKINENNPIGEKVIQVNATDADEGENAKITYSLLDRANFKVDSITGWITANMVFDRETRDSYQVTVIAMDHGKPRLSSSVLLNLTVLDTNDHRPQLASYETDAHLLDHASLQYGRVGFGNLFAVTENLPANSYVGDVLAKDDDIGQNAQLQFELVNDMLTQYSTRFRLLRNGSLYTTIELDREEKEHYRLTVRVSDRSPTEALTSTGTISIIVLDVNDNAPTFTQPSGLLSTNATKMFYSESGELTNILYDQPTSKTSHQIHKGLDKEQLQSSTQGGATSVNPTLKLSVYEKPGQLLTNLHAKDPDAGANGRVIYELVEFFKFPAPRGVLLNPLIRVHPEQGDVILQRHMSESDLGLHFFEVSASDGGNPEPKLDSKVLVVLVEDVPASGTRPVAALASSYYSNNRTSVEVDLWGFEGKSNMFIITVLASVSGLLAIVLVTAILCVVRPCGKNRGTLCARRRSERRNRRRPITSPGGSETGNGFGMRAAGMDGDGDGSGMPYGFSGLNGHANNPYPGLHSAEVDPSLLLPSADDWHPHCGNDGCGYGNVTYPYRHANATQTTQSNQCRLHETAAISQQSNTKNERTTIKSNDFASRTVGVRILSNLTGSDEVYVCQSPLTLPRSNSPTGVSIVGNSRRTAQNGDSVFGISTSEHSHFISRPIPIKQSVQQNPTQVPIKLDYEVFVDYPQWAGSNLFGKELHPNNSSFNPISHSLLELHSELTQSARALQRPEEQASDSGRGGSEEEEQSSHPIPQLICASREGVEVDSEQAPTEHRCTHYTNLQGTGAMFANSFKPTSVILTQQMESPTRAKVNDPIMPPNSAEAHLELSNTWCETWSASHSSLPVDHKATQTYRITEAI
ncbi:hypothetical protein P879_07502 [Paragonimus westermani]|uniref:Cadherin domain-containing protein n=1 Tax=Paragonimus westermani TaxID=34504 RepID=A0A8T0DAG1_9TREM|nr:hypothetical protein P879_07502 [Paragonimus westermani]